MALHIVKVLLVVQKCLDTLDANLNAVGRVEGSISRATASGGSKESRGGQRRNPKGLGNESSPGSCNKLSE